MSTSEVLNKAADLIEQRGWAVGGGWPAPEDPDSRICLEGGLVAAMDLGLYTEWSNEELDEFENCPAYAAVQEHLETGRHLYEWNDEVGRTASEVVEVLRATALIESARERETVEVSA